MNQSIVNIIAEKALSDLSENKDIEIEMPEEVYAELKVVNEAPYYTLIINDTTYIHLDIFWRALGEDRILFTSEDDDQMLGRKTPLSVLEEFNSYFDKKEIESIIIKNPIADLKVNFNGGYALEIVASSCGYENWAIADQEQQIICLGGGATKDLSIF